MKAGRSGIVEELKAKYQKALSRARRDMKPFQPYEPCPSNCEADMLLFQKWAYRVGKGWYGFSLGHIPPVWRQIIDEFLGWLEIQSPDFEIHQIKMKMGGLRFYVGTKDDVVFKDEHILSDIWKLEHLLRFPALPPKQVCKTRKKRQNPSRKQ